MDTPAIPNEIALAIIGEVGRLDGRLLELAVANVNNRALAERNAELEAAMAALNDADVVDELDD